MPNIEKIVPIMFRTMKNIIVLLQPKLEETIPKITPDKEAAK